MNRFFYDVDLHGYLVKRFDDGRTERVPRVRAIRMVLDEPAPSRALSAPTAPAGNPLCQTCKMVRVSRSHFIRCHECSNEFQRARSMEKLAELNAAKRAARAA